MTVSVVTFEMSTRKAHRTGHCSMFDTSESSIASASHKISLVEVGGMIQRTQLA